MSPRTALEITREKVVAFFISEYLPVPEESFPVSLIMVPSFSQMYGFFSSKFSGKQVSWKSSPQFAIPVPALNSGCPTSSKYQKMVSNNDEIALTV